MEGSLSLGSPRLFPVAAPAPPAGRDLSLDALRGVAAFAVVIYHCLLFFPWLFDILEGLGKNAYTLGDHSVFLLTALPPSLLWSGREAVLLFFVLSGFVLALPFLSARPPSYLPFLARRCCRLFLPCIAIVLVALLLQLLLGRPSRPDLAGTFNDLCWQESPTPLLVLRHLLLIGDYYSLNVPIWTLHFEWQAALLFPFIVWLSARGPFLAVGVALAGAVGAYLLRAWLGATGQLNAFTALPQFLYFMPYFLFGVLLARHRAALSPAIARLPRWRRLGLWLLCFVLLKLRWLVPAPSLLDDLACGAGAAMLIALIINSPAAQSCLMRGPLPWLGRVSFSLYLVHMPVILAALALLPQALPIGVALAVGVVASFGAAAVLFHLVERPSIVLGRECAMRLEAWLLQQRLLASLRQALPLHR